MTSWEGGGISRGLFYDTLPVSAFRDQEQYENRKYAESTYFPGSEPENSQMGS
jgi:hypothetical protein